MILTLRSGIKWEIRSIFVWDLPTTRGEGLPWSGWKVILGQASLWFYVVAAVVGNPRCCAVSIISSRNSMRGSSPAFVGSMAMISRIEASGLWENRLHRSFRTQDHSFLPWTVRLRLHSVWKILGYPMMYWLLAWTRAFKSLDWIIWRTDRSW